MGNWQSVLEGLVDLLFPPHCISCQRSGGILCSSCSAHILHVSPPFCNHCHTPLLFNTFCYSCAFHMLQFNGLRLVGPFQDPLRSYILAFKYNKGNTRLARPLGSLLAQTYQRSGLAADLIIPVPLHPERQRRRGYNQAQLLAEVCSSALGIPFSSSLLVRIRATEAQAQIAKEKRHQNMTGAFALHANNAANIIAQRNILLIDDVCTTGSTLEACAAPLFAAGARTVWGLVLARPLQFSFQSQAKIDKSERQ